MKLPASKPIYLETHRLVEKICKIMTFVLLNVTVPSFVIPKAILCLSLYFTTDLGPDAFDLPLPLW